MHKFLPINLKEAQTRGWNNVDFVLVSGDAYIDHPSFGISIIARVLENYGYKIGIIPQPDIKNPESFKIFGKPNLGFLVSSGNIDSMVAKYTSFKKKRKTDFYSPGGKTDLRPERALIPYTSAIRSVYKDTFVILGGLEASLRRLSHYDYWSNSVRRSILIDSKADMLMYGMGEKTVCEIADKLKAGKHIKEITNIRGTVYRTTAKPEIPNSIFLHPFETASKDKKAFAENFALSYKNSDPLTAFTLIEQTGSQFVVQNKPPLPLTREELDRVYSLPFAREAHPIYKESGGVPALEEVKFSITSSRGCFGACSFCSIVYHQGKKVTSRSHDSIINEAKVLTSLKDFKGYIHDVGGPTANFRNPACKKQEEKGSCERRCLTPTPCKNLDISHIDFIQLLRKLRTIPGIKKVFIRSGIRFDYLMYDSDVAQNKKGNFLSELCEHHISGQLKVAPEHISNNVLKIMGKSEKSVYEKFVARFKEENSKLGKKQFLIPYFISSHPGSTLTDAIELALYLKKNKFIPDQIQDFYPTPGTLSTCMYYTGFDPLTLKKVYTPTTEEEKRMQKALIHFHKPENYDLVKKALLKAGRKDLIGNHKDALIPSRKIISV